MFKQIMQSNVMQAIIGCLIASYMTLVKYTTRWEIEGFEGVSRHIGNGKGLIALTWHSRFMMLPSAWKKQWQPPRVLISMSRDGGIVAHTVRFLGMDTIRGSAKKEGSQKAKGGSRALREMKTLIDTGHCVVITPDGPRGPRQRMNDGALGLAKMSGAPIIPCIFAVKNRKQFNSWDKFVLPLPFGKGRIIWGTPVFIPETADDSELAAIRDVIETEMNFNLSKADTELGHTPTEAEPPRQRRRS